MLCRLLLASLPTSCSTDSQPGGTLTKNDGDGSLHPPVTDKTKKVGHWDSEVWWVVWNMLHLLSARHGYGSYDSHLLP